MTQRVAIGVDVGGTKIAVAAVDVQAGNILLRDEIPTLRQEGGERVLERVREVVSIVHGSLVEQNIQTSGIGIGVPELVNNSGAIKSNWNFDWNQRSVSDELSEFGRVILESDARTATLAEAHFGHGRKYPSFVFVTIGSGLSFAFWNNEQIHRGANGYAIHFGSSDIVPVCNACGAQGAFNLEALASGRGLANTYQKQTGLQLNTHQLIDGSAGEAGTKILEQATTALGSYLGQLINILDPHAMIIGGGLGMAPGFSKMLEGKIRPFIWAEDCRSIPIAASAIPKDGAAIGAAALFR